MECTRIRDSCFKLVDTFQMLPSPRGVKKGSKYLVLHEVESSDSTDSSVDSDSTEVSLLEEVDAKAQLCLDHDAVRPVAHPFSFYVITLCVSFDKYIHVLWNRDGCQRRSRDCREPGEPGSGRLARRKERMSAATYERLCRIAHGSTITWPTWLRICDNSVTKACLTLMYAQFATSLIVSSASAVNLGPFRLSHVGYHIAFKQFFRAFEPTLERHADVTI